jgi:hypothetical protein
MHEYLRDTLDETYIECKSCKTRTEYTCIKCGFCWSCHWKQEQTDKFQFRPFILNNNNNKIYDSKHSLSSTIQPVKYGESKSLLTNIFDDQKIIDVFGIDTEPICNYLRCHHKFSMHGTKINNNNCKCQHPRNRITGVAKS